MLVQEETYLRRVPSPAIIPGGELLSSFADRNITGVAEHVMPFAQRSIQLSPRARGCHLITEEIVRALADLPRVSCGLLHIFIQHTSASLTINENADSDVRHDLDASLDAIAPEDFPYQHTVEGPDDMPAHVKASLMGSSVTIPVRDGMLQLGTWQGIYLCEHRNQGGMRRLVLTLWGE